MFSYKYMTIRILALSALLTFPLFWAPEAHAATSSLSIKSVTVTKAPPTCEARSTKKRMASGSVTEIVWKSKHATSMTGLTADERVWPTKGRERVAIAFVGKHEFPLVFEGPGGKTTCVAKVFVKPRAR